MGTLAERLAEFVCNFSFQDMTHGQVSKLKLYFLDWLGSAYAGGGQRPVKMILEVAKRQGGAPQSTLIPDGSKTSSLLASLVNGASSHVVEMDDLHKESILHPGAAIIPAIFACAESEHSTGRDFLVAVAVGYEVAIRIAVSVGPSHYRFWHTTGTCGTFGAAAGAGRLLGLSAEQMTWALGSAGTQAAGLWAFLVENAMSKQLHAAKASMNGLLSALLAREGFTGAKGILEAEKGFFRATSQDFDQSKCIQGLGEEFWFEMNSLKYYPSCGHTHSAIDAVLKATGGHPLHPGDISKVRVRLYSTALDLLQDVKPVSPYLAKFSLPFCIGTALLYGEVRRDCFTQERLEDQRLREVMDLVMLEEDPELSKAFPQKWPCRVEIHLRSGKILEGSCDHPKGDPQNPLTIDEVARKFLDLTTGILPEPRAKALIDKVLILEEIGDMASLVH